MDLLPNDEQNQIVDACVQYLLNEHRVDTLQQVNARDRPLLSTQQRQQMAELGWFGMGLDEAHGGVGYSLKEEMLLFVELGRFLVSPALLASVLGARLAALAGHQTLAAQIISGECGVAPAISTRAGSTVGEQCMGDFYVFESQHAELLLLIDEHGMALVNKIAATKSTPITCMDEKIHMLQLTLDAPAQVYLGSDADNLYLRGVLLSAAMQLGIAQATRDRSVEYAKVREQYGKPIGSFQAIKHTCAEMAVRCESVMSLLYHAAIVLDQPQGPYGDNGPFDTTAVKLLASHAAQHNANEAVQVHGGMGFTQEMDIHLFVKRAHVLDQLFGSKRQQAHTLIALNGPRL